MHSPIAFTLPADAVPSQCSVASSFLVHDLLSCPKSLIQSNKRPTWKRLLATLLEMYLNALQSGDLIIFGYPRCEGGHKQ